MMDNGGGRSPPENMDELKESGSSLSLSFTPPILHDDKQTDESISEHITPHTDSVENDRSYQEIEISNKADEIRDVLDSSTNSIISLNFLERITHNDNIDSEVKDIIEQLILNVPYACTNSSSDSEEVSLNIFANVDLDDKSLTSRRTDVPKLVPYHFGSVQVNNGLVLDRIIKDTEELLPLKENVCVALAELDSFRELSNTNSSLSKTEYRQIHEDAQSKIVDQTILLKNELIHQLSESLDQSVAERRNLLNQICLFKEEIAVLKEKLEDTTKMMSGRKYQTPVKDIEVAKNVREIDKEVRDQDVDFDIDKAFSDVEANLNDDQKHLLKDLKLHVNLLRERSMSVNNDICRQELDILKRERQTEKEEYEAEIGRLRGLLANIKCGSTEIMEMKEQLETQHSQEMEELRTYFEKKCADLEKNYSEEIFSQQSRKMSGSTSSEAELNSDVLFSQTPGPAGDTSYDLKPKLTRRDIASLQNDLNNLLDVTRKYGDVEKITDHDFEALEKDIAQMNLASVLKIDLSHVKKDMQNKYHAELEILREDGENRVDALNVEYERKLKAVQERYEAKIEELKGQLEELEPRQNVIVSSAVQEVSNSGDFEIVEVIQSYERRLQEQVALAKIDLISAIESQIQHLASHELDQVVWPSDLVQLRDRFAEKYEEEIRQLKDEHKTEVERLKEEHLRILNGALERARRRSLREGDSIGKSEMDILRERDNLKKQVTSLRGFLGELVRYFTQCEDELNNTLVDELLRQGLDRSMTQTEEDQNPSSPTNSSRTSENSTVTRVHLTPNFADLINRIETNSQGDSSPLDVSLDLKNELGTCLEKLKQEANAILALTSNIHRTEDGASKPTESTSEDKIDSLKRQLIDACRSKESFKEQLDEAVRYAEALETQKDALVEQLQLAKEAILEKDLVRSGCKEVVVSEGYGQGSSIAETGDPVETLANLQERARSMLAESRGSADPTLLTLIEDLCSVAEAVKADLLQQIDVADKKYKTTQQFLDDQAVERELERDEAQKKINSLHEQLRERSKDRNSCERAMAEVNCKCSNCCTVEAQVEHLEQQLQEMTRSLSEVQQRQKDVETERDEAVEKIKVLRDIIRDLEQQSESTAARLDGYESRVQELQRCLLECQTASGKAHDSTEEVAELYAHIEHLENEVQRLRTYSELVGSEGALTELTRQLSDLDTQLERKTRLLETLHSTGNTNCSSPSEDLSVRDIVRSNSQAMEECEVPLQQLARLKERLVKHSRAEDTAIKRIKDLEMEVFGLRNELEEANNERDYMKRQIQEQLVLISDFQIRLDEQRIITERIEKETNTSLEHRLYDMQTEIVSLTDHLETKEKALNHQRTLLQETRAQVCKLEEELTSTKDDEIIVEMQKELEKLRMENANMKEKIEKDKSIVPNLVENIISDKNTDIEKLRDKLHCAEKLLDTYTSLNLGPRELETLSRLKSDSTTWDHMISSIEMGGPEQARRADYHRHSEDEYSNSAVLMKSSEGTSLEPEISAIEKQVPLKNSTELSHRKVRFLDAEELERLEREVQRLKSELEMKETLTAEYQQRLKLLDDLEKKMEQLQSALDKTEEDLARATETFQKEQKEMEEREKDLQVELAEGKLKLTETLKKIEILEQDSNRKDNVCLNLTREKRELEMALKTARNENFTSLLSSKDDEIGKLHMRLKEQLDELIALKAAHENCPKVADILRREQQDAQRETERLRDKLKRRQKEIKEHTFTIEKYEREKVNLEAENKRLRQFLLEREEEAAKAIKEAKQCEKEVLLCEQEVLEWRGDNENLTAELKQVQQVVEDKDKVIRQMEEDYKTVHANLLEVERKLKEAGNVRDLMAKLKQEQMRSEQFYEQIHDLKIQLLAYKNDPSACSVDDVTDKVRQELDEAAKIDTSILSAVSDHGLNSLAESWDMEAYRRALVKEKEFVDRLAKQNEQLRELVAREQEAIKEMKKSERDTIAKTMFKLRENQAREARLEEMLEERKKACQKLQEEITALRLAQATPSLRTESTHYKSLPDTLTMELNRLKGEMEQFKAEKRDLVGEIARTREALAVKEGEAKSAQDMLTTELLRCKKLHEKMQEFARVECELREELVRKNAEIERITSERECEKAALVQQKNHLLEQLKTSAGPGKNQRPATVPATDTMLNHLKDLNAALLDNRKLMMEVQKLMDEKRSLKIELEGIRRHSTNNVHLDQVADRADYLFAKTLRYESVNKALVWQKRYLINYVCAHQRLCALSTISNPLAISQSERESRNASPISRFRRAAYVMIAVARMRYLVLRWHSGVRRAEQVNMYHYRHHPRRQEVAPPPNTQFQVGQPVSSQLFRGIVPTPLFENPERDHDGREASGATCSRVEVAWSGQSPPSRDTQTAACAISGSNKSRGAEETQRIPHLLDRCSERISLIQDRLRFMLDENK